MSKEKLNLWGNCPQLKTFDEKAAIKLENIIRIKRKVFRKINKKQWVLHFKRFRTKSGIEKQRIKKVLIWYTKHFGEEYVPVAYSAGSFCNKFLRIEDAMERSIKNAKKEKKVKYNIKEKRTVIVK